MKQQTMHAVVCHRFGWPQPLQVEEWPRPERGRGQLLLRVAAAGLNFADSLQIAGNYQERQSPPFVPGAEVIGTVVEADADTEWPVGTRVMGQVSHGAYAEFVLADPSRVVEVPSAMPDEVAAGFFIPYGTAYCTLARRARLRAGERVLVLGAAGAVGLACVEVARALGAEVIGAVGSAEKFDAVSTHGAAHVIDYRHEDLRNAVMQATHGEGVDVVVDTVGGALTLAALRCLRFEGRLAVLGFTGGQAAQFPANHMLVKNIDVLGVFWGPYQTREPATTRSDFARLFAWVAEGSLRPSVAARFPLHETGTALQRLLAREFAGKVVIDISPTQGNAS